MCVCVCVCAASAVSLAVSRRRGFSLLYDWACWYGADVAKKSKINQTTSKVEEECETRQLPSVPSSQLNWLCAVKNLKFVKGGYSEKCMVSLLLPI